MLYVRLTIKVKVGIQEISFKVGWYPHKITGLSHLKWGINFCNLNLPYFILTPNKEYVISK